MHRHLPDNFLSVFLWYLNYAKAVMLRLCNSYTETITFDFLIVNIKAKGCVNDKRVNVMLLLKMCYLFLRKI